MRRRAKSSLSWGAVGTLTFLVLAQGYVIAGERLPVSFALLVAVAALVGGVVACVTYLLEPRLAKKGRT